MVLRRDDLETVGERKGVVGDPACLAGERWGGSRGEGGGGQGDEQRTHANSGREKDLREGAATAPGTGPGRWVREWPGVAPRSRAASRTGRCCSGGASHRDAASRSPPRRGRRFPSPGESSPAIGGGECRTRPA